jgi:hypothetical protein
MEIFVRLKLISERFIVGLKTLSFETNVELYLGATTFSIMTLGITTPSNSAPGHSL